MSTYKKIDNSQKILKLSPRPLTPTSKTQGCFLSKLNIRFYECCGFYAARFWIPRYDFASATLRVARGCRTSCLMAK